MGVPAFAVLWRPPRWAGSTRGRSAIRGGVRPGGREVAVVGGAFAFFGFFWGNFAVLLADLSRALDLSPGWLGFVLFVGAAIAILSVATLGPLADSLGRRPFLLLSAGGFGLGIVGLALADGLLSLLGALVVLSASAGLYDVGINAGTVDMELATGRHLMSPLHAAFSFGGMFGAVFAGVLRELSVDYRVVYLAILVPLLAVMISFWREGLPGPLPGVGGDGERTRRRDLLREGPLLLIAGIATLGLLSEGEMEHWSGIYLRESLGLPALLGGSGVAVFYGAMGLGRLGSSVVIARFGERATLLGAGATTAGGMALSLATVEPVFVVGGFLLVGLALSAVAPIAFSAAGAVAPDSPGGAISFVTTLAYGGFLLGPVLVGGLAEVFGLRVALLTIALAGASVFVLGTRLPRRGARKGF